MYLFIRDIIMNLIVCFQIKLMWIIVEFWDNANIFLSIQLFHIICGNQFVSNPFYLQNGFLEDIYPFRNIFDK